MTTRILVGHVLDRLRELPDESVHCVCTSPPYWGLRAYLPDGHPDKAYEIGLEPTYQRYIERIVEVFREVRRVLRKDGTCWLNLGDSYANDGKWGGETGGKQHYLGEANRKRVGREKRVTGLKPKDLVMIPARVAIALQDDGWWLRSDIIWHKLNPMPESTTDRPTTAHEHVFLLAKAERYFYDAEAIKEPASQDTHARLPGNKKRPAGWADYEGAHGAFHKDGRAAPEAQRKLATAGSGIKNNTSMDAALAVMPETRNKRSVWSIATAPFPEAHFATFPPDLVEPCILAGTSERGCCGQCGAPHERVVEKTRTRDGEPLAGGWPVNEGGVRIGASGVGHWRDKSESETTGWQPTCRCGVAETVPCTVLDCFGGAGTTALVADRLGRDAILVELNENYAAMAFSRLQRDAGLFAEVELIRDDAGCIATPLANDTTGTGSQDCPARAILNSDAG